MIYKRPTLFNMGFSECSHQTWTSPAFRPFHNSMMCFRKGLFIAIPFIHRTLSLLCHIWCNNNNEGLQRNGKRLEQRC